MILFQTLFTLPISLFTIGFNGLCLIIVLFAKGCRKMTLRERAMTAVYFEGWFFIAYTILMLITTILIMLS